MSPVPQEVAASFLKHGFDLTKPLRTVGGKSVRILGYDKTSYYQSFCLIAEVCTPLPFSFKLERFDQLGQSFFGTSDILDDLVRNVAPEWKGEPWTVATSTKTLEQVDLRAPTSPPIPGMTSTVKQRMLDNGLDVDKPLFTMDGRPVRVIAIDETKYWVSSFIVAEVGVKLTSHLDRFSAQVGDKPAFYLDRFSAQGNSYSAKCALAKNTWTRREKLEIEMKVRRTEAQKQAEELRAAISTAACEVEAKGATAQAEAQKQEPSKSREAELYEAMHNLRKAVGKVYEGHNFIVKISIDASKP